MLIAGYSSTANYINHHLFLYYLEANFNGFELTFMLLRYFRYQRDIFIAYILTSLQTSFLLPFYVWRVSHQLSDNKISFFQESIKQCT